MVLSQDAKIMNKEISVLLVEDHGIVLDGLTSGLSCEPDLRIVGSASTSDDGLTLAQQLRPDIVLLDLHLPGQLSIKPMLEAFCSIAGVKIVVFSGESRRTFVQLVLKMGVAGYLLKSENATAVAAVIRRIMAGEKPVVSGPLIAAKSNVRLTQAEQHVLAMLAHGMKYEEMAQTRVTSTSTIRKQVELLLEKLQLKTREELIAWAVDNGFKALELSRED